VPLATDDNWAENYRVFMDDVQEAMQQLNEVIKNPVFKSMHIPFQDVLSHALGVLVAIRGGYEL